MSTKEQEAQRQEFYSKCKDWINEIDIIDKNTPVNDSRSLISPEWWDDMMDIRGEMQRFIDENEPT